ncbi:hypothetical protein [Streptomyces sp. TS71-3]|uniref:hypothetical protein n=1 Tax=Streptomyces sp. TS71-3 TaxID=2733862 RepID=UPI001BB33C0C|nr:hypothetical protein [Streptomyces sp. TS71-3]
MNQHTTRDDADRPGGNPFRDDGVESTADYGDPYADVADALAICRGYADGPDQGRSLARVLGTLRHITPP